MTLAFQWILGVLVAAPSLIIPSCLGPLFRIFGDIAAAGGAVTPEQDAALTTYLTWLAAALAATILGVAMSLAHLRRGCGPTAHRWRWILLLLLANPVALPVYFGLCVCGGEPDGDGAPPQSLPLVTFANALALILVATAAVDLIAIWAGTELIEVVGRGDLTGTEIDVADEFYSFVALLQVIYLPVGAPFFMAWFYRAYHNLRAAGLEGVTYAPGWTIAGFCIPIVNLFRPFAIMMEVGRGSLAIADSSKSAAWKTLPGLTLVWVWWTLWLAHALLCRIAPRIVGNGEGLESVTTGLAVESVGIGVHALSAVVAVLMVMKITRLQQDHQPREREGLTG